MRLISAFLAGTVLGAAVCAWVLVWGPGVALRSESQSAGAGVPQRPSAPPASSGRADAPVAGAARLAGSPEVERLARQIAELQESVAAETERRIDAEGTPLQFPPSADLTNIEQRLAAIVEEALRPTEATVAAVDCLEYPCLTYIVAPPSLADTDAQRSAMQNLIDALSELGLVPASMWLNPADVRLSAAGLVAQEHPISMALATEYREGSISPEDRRRRVEARVNQFFASLSD